MTEVNEQVREFIDFLDNDEALDKTIRHMKKINKFLKNEIAELKKEKVKDYGNCKYGYYGNMCTRDDTECCKGCKYWELAE